MQPSITPKEQPYKPWKPITPFEDKNFRNYPTSEHQQILSMLQQIKVELAEIKTLLKQQKKEE